VPGPLCEAHHHAKASTDSGTDRQTVPGMQAGTVKTRLVATRAALFPWLLLLTGVLLGLAPESTILRNGELRRTDILNANLEVPYGARLLAVDGREPAFLERTPLGNGERVHFEHLEPGTYVVEWAGPGLGGWHFSRKANVVLVEAVDTGAWGVGRDALRTGLLVLSYSLILVLAARAGKRKRTIDGAALVFTLAAWAATGWNTPGLREILVSLSAVSAGILAFRSQRSTQGASLVTAVTVLLWPGTASVVLALLAAGAVAFYGHKGTSEEQPVAQRSLRNIALGGIVLGLVVVAWFGHSGTTGNDIARSGRVSDTGLDFTDCAARERTSPLLARDCFRAVGARLGANLPPKEASQALLTGLEGSGVRQDSQCRTAGAALSYAAARWGSGRNDPRGLFVDLAPICDYSSMHGIVAGAFAHSDDTAFPSLVLDLCEPASPDETRLNSPEYSRQCWQAAGIALGRRTRYNDPDVLLFCRQATPYGMNNCTDGYFQEFVDQKARTAAEPNARLHPEGATVLSLCSRLPDELAGGCYRYVGEEVFYDGGTRTEGLAELTDVCANRIPDGHRTACWYALGMVSVRSLLQGTFDELETPVLETCPSAPTEQTLLQCLHGGGNAIVGLLGRDFPLERICGWFPEARRDEYCRYTEAYRDHLREGDPQN
jgi:hypothetical protein